eukprot:jgi/Chrzof1/388/Cz01g14020.t1
MLGMIFRCYLRCVLACCEWAVLALTHAFLLLGLEPTWYKHAQKVAQQDSKAAIPGLKQQLQNKHSTQQAQQIHKSQLQAAYKQNMQLQHRLLVIEQILQQHCDPDALQLLAECKCGSPTMLSSPDIIKAAQFIKQHHADSYRCLVDAGMGDADCCIAAVKQNTKVTSLQCVDDDFCLRSCDSDEQAEYCEDSQMQSTQMPCVFDECICATDWLLDEVDSSQKHCYRPPALELDDGSCRLLLDAAPQEFLCPIGLDLITDPVVTPCGVTYNRPCIQQWIHRYGQDPGTNAPLTVGQLYPNLAMRDRIQKWLSDQGFET